VKPNVTIGAGGVFPVPAEDGYADELLGPAEYVDVPFTICLNNTKPFTFFVDVLGVVVSDNLLINGDVEQGTLNGWTVDESQAVNAGVISAVQDQPQATGVVQPKQGSWFFSFANDFTCATADCGATISMLQSGTVPACDRLQLSGFVQTESTRVADEGEAILTIYSPSVPSGFVRAQSGPLVTPNFVWQPFAAELKVPPDAQRWEVMLKGTVLNTFAANVFYDDVRLECR
jgi:hypothetical protein